MGKVKDIILGIAIAIIFALFIGFGINAFYSQPVMEKFCKGIDVNIPTDTCPDAQIKKPISPERSFESCYCETNCSSGTCIETGKCYKTNPEYTACQKHFDDAREIYSRNIFIIAAIVGLITMLIGGFVLSHDSVSPGLMGGGFITIVYGVIIFWRYAGSKLRFIILGVVLGMLIYVAYRKWPGEKNKKKKKNK